MHHHDDHDDHGYLLKSGRVQLSLEELSGLLKSVQKPPAPKTALGNPGPLGLGSFALTTMTLSIYNAGILKETSGVVLPLALFYGGIAQFIAGLYEYRISNTFGATAFCSYGAFWCSFASYVYLIVPTLPEDKAHEATGLFLFMWLIFTLYMTLASFRVSFLLACLFSVLSVTFTLLVIGEWAEESGITKAGGALGMVTAGLAWYGSAASVINTTWDRELLPLGLWVRPKPKYRKENTETVMPLLELTTFDSESESEDDHHDDHHPNPDQIRLTPSEGADSVSSASSSASSSSPPASRSSSRGRSHHRHQKHNQPQGRKERVFLSSVKEIARKVSHTGH